MSRGLHLPLQGQLQWAGLVISMCVQGGVNGQRGSKPVSLDGPCNFPLSSSLTLSDGETLSVQGGDGGGGISCKPCLKFFSGTSWACCTTRKKRASELGTRHTREGCRLSDQVPSGPIFSPSAVNQSPYWWLCHIQYWTPPPTSQRILDTLGGSMFLPSWRQQTWTRL